MLRSRLLPAASAALLALALTPAAMAAQGAGSDATTHRAERVARGVGRGLTATGGG